jgi:hypothetical protein
MAERVGENTYVSYLGAKSTPSSSLGNAKQIFNCMTNTNMSKCLYRQRTPAAQ